LPKYLKNKELEIELNVRPAFGEELEIKIHENTINWKGNLSLSEIPLYSPKTTGELKVPNGSYSYLLGDILSSQIRIFLNLPWDWTVQHAR
jgi:hypothetical protein